MPPDTVQIEPRPPAVRPGKARLSSLDSMDKRTSAYRETRKLIDEIEGDLGGSDRLSTAERQLVQHAAVQGAFLADLEARWLQGEPIDPIEHCTISNSQRRLIETVGLRRVPRDVVPRLRDYLEGKAAETGAA